MLMNADQRTDIVRRLGLTAAKARSNAREAGYLEVAEMCDPALYGEGDLSLIAVSERMLDGGREVAPLDAYNILFLTHRSPTAAFAYGVFWQEDLPKPAEALAEGLL